MKTLTVWINLKKKKSKAATHGIKKKVGEHVNETNIKPGIKSKDLLLRKQELPV